MATNSSCIDGPESCELLMSCPRNGTTRPNTGQSLSSTTNRPTVDLDFEDLMRQMKTSIVSFHDNHDVLMGLLLKIKTTLFSATLVQRKELLDNASMEPVFACLKQTCQDASSEDRELIEIIGQILPHMLNTLEPAIVLNQLRDEIYDGVGHPDETIRMTCLKQVQRVSKCKTAVEMLHSDADMIAMIISTVGDESLAVAQVASSTLLDTMISSEMSVLQRLLSGSYLALINRVVNKGDTYRYRIFEIIIKVAAHSSNMLLSVAQCGLLQDLLLDLTTEDELIQMNAVEMLITLATCRHGLQYLDRHGILSKMEEILVTKEVDHLLIPSFFKFFSCVAKFEPKTIIGWTKSFFNFTLDVLCSDNSTLQASAIDVVAAVGSSLVGKEVLHNQGPLMIAILQEFGKLILRSTIELRVYSLKGLTNLFSLENTEEAKSMMPILELWFNHVTSNLLDTVIVISKKPFTEEKCAAFSLLQVIANQEWALKKLKRIGGFHEYLLDRSYEHDQSSSVAKFDLIKTLAQCDIAEKIFGKPFLHELKEYVRIGPFRVSVQSEVSYEI